MDKVRRIKFSELPDLSAILQYTLESGRVSLWLDLGNGEQGLFETRDQRVYRTLAESHKVGKPPQYAWRGGAHRVLFVGGHFADRDEVERVSYPRTDIAEMKRAKPARIDGADDLIDAIMKEMERVWAEGEFNGLDGEYTWLLKHYSVTEEEDVAWINICNYYINELSSEDEADEDLMRFLKDDRAIYAFLEQLLQKHRSNTITYKII
jgi:hypothetical protein